MTTTTFSSLWTNLKNCYVANGRDISFAYGYLDSIDKLYSCTLHDTIVRKVLLTNAPIDRSEKRDALIRNATNDATFYAILTLLPGPELRMNVYDSNDWLKESRIFGSVVEKQKIVRILTNDNFIRRAYTRENRREYRYDDDENDYDDRNDDDVAMDYVNFENFAITRKKVRDNYDKSSDVNENGNDVRGINDNYTGDNFNRDHLDYRSNMDPLMNNHLEDFEQLEPVNEGTRSE